MEPFSRNPFNAMQLNRSLNLVGAQRRAQAQAAAAAAAALPHQYLQQQQQQQRNAVLDALLCKHLQGYIDHLKQAKQRLETDILFSEVQPITINNTPKPPAVPLSVPSSSMMMGMVAEHSSPAPPALAAVTSSSSSSTTLSATPTLLQRDDSTSSQATAPTRPAASATASDCQVKQNFPRVLMNILAEKTCEGIIEWTPTGREFVILNKDALSGDVLPRYFAKCKFASFARKLNRWGFKFDRDTSTYSHPHFLRDNPRLLQQMYTKEGKLSHVTPAKKSFPCILLSILEQKQSENIIEWMPDGRSFILIDTAAFERTILQNQFNGCKLASFARKLYRWGFKFDRNLGVYSHPLFRKNQPDLAKLMNAQDGEKRQGTPKQQQTQEQQQHHQQQRMLLPSSAGFKSTGNP